MTTAIITAAVVVAVAMAVATVRIVIKDERENRVCKHYNGGDCVCFDKKMVVPLILPCDEKCSLCNKATNELRKKDQR